MLWLSASCCHVVFETNIIPSKLKFLAYEVINTKPILLYQLSEHNEHLSSVELQRVCLYEIFFVILLYLGTIFIEFFEK